MHAVAEAWFPDEAWLLAADGEDFRLLLGAAVMRHPLARALVRAGSGRLLSWEALAAEVRRGEAALVARAPEEAETALRRLLTLLSWSKREVGSKRMPLASVQVQLWVREARKLLREVETEGQAPRFRWHDDGKGARARPRSRWCIVGSAGTPAGSRWARPSEIGCRSRTRRLPARWSSAIPR